MKRLIFSLALLVPAISYAQSIPQMGRRVTLAGPTGLNWALSTKADINNGSLVGPVITGGRQNAVTLDSKSILNGSQLVGGKAPQTDISASLSTANNGKIAGTMARTPAERAMSMPQPGDFLGASGTVASLISGGIDVGPIINTMISDGVKTVHLPCGTYKLATQIALSNSVSLSGDGACTIFSIQNAGSDMIYGSSVWLVRIHDLTMQADVTRTGGAAIKFLSAYENHIFRVWFTNGAGKHYTNIYLDGANSTHIDSVTGRGGAWDGIVVTGSSARSEDTYITHSNFNGYSGSALELIWASGNYLTDLDLLGSTNGGVVIDPGSNQEVDGTRATAVLADSNIGPGWLLSGTGNITEFSMVNSWGSTNGIGGAQAGFDAENANISDASVINSEFHGNTGPGLKVNAGQHWIINSNQMCMNSTYGSAAYSGLEIGANPNFLVVTANISGACGVDLSKAVNGKSLQAYGINSAQPATDTGHYALFGNNMGAGNQTGGFNIGTGTNVTTSNNVGL